MTCRRNRDATRKDLRHAAALLIAAAGVQLPAALNVTAGADTASDAFGSLYTSGLQFSDSASLPALMELARAYEAGTLSATLACWCSRRAYLLVADDLGILPFKTCKLH